MHCFSLSLSNNNNYWYQYSDHLLHVMYMYLFSYRARSGSTSKMIDTSVTQLSGYIQLATDSIFESFEKCPLVLRQSMRLLWDRVIAKFPDNVSTCIIYIIIIKCKPAWYLFTRFSVIEWVWEGLWVFSWFFNYLYSCNCFCVQLHVNEKFRIIVV